MQLATITDETRLALSTLVERATGLVAPSLRLGVTGLARAGKTIFITALVHNLTHGGRLPLFKAYAAGRVAGAELQPQPDDAVPRFDYEAHVRSLVDERIWPDSTRRVSELRLTIRYESASYLSRTFGSGRLNLDIVDYPGEWLLDLPLLGKDFPTWSREALALAEAELRRELSAAWRAQLSVTDANAPEDESVARGAGAPLHGLSPGGARARERLLDPHARPLPHAGRSRRLAGADLLAAGHRRKRRPGFPRRHDGPAL